MRNKCLVRLGFLALLAGGPCLPRATAAGLASSTPAEEARAIVEALVSCGTRHSLSSWTDTRRGIGCGRDAVVRHLEAVENESGKRMRVVIDKFETSGPRTKNVPVPMENVYAGSSCRARGHDGRRRREASGAVPSGDDPERFEQQ